MNIRHILSLNIFVMISFLSCEKDIKNPTLDDFCNIKPNGWECEIIQENFDPNDFPRNNPVPYAIVKYSNPNRECLSLNMKITPSLILDMYPIKQKEELIGLVKSQMMYSWCIPMYYGETKDYFIITSPCFNNGGACMTDLQNALKNVITVNDYKIYED